MLRKLLGRLRKNNPIIGLRLLGSGVECDASVSVVHPERLAIGNYVYIGPRTYLNATGGLEIHDHTIISQEVAVLSSLHRYKESTMVPYDAVELLRPVTIERCVWIGLRAIIMPGVTIGEGSIVGAGAVVTKSCAAGSILAGNPARVVATRDMERYQELVDNKQFYLLKKQTECFSKTEVLDLKEEKDCLEVS
ncbi:MAG: acyltransferase [Armatimonadetes bacterium]|nr:acyltransferase [Armatimonadota bacterium]